MIKQSQTHTRLFPFALVILLFSFASLPGQTNEEKAEQVFFTAKGMLPISFMIWQRINSAIF